MFEKILQSIKNKGLTIEDIFKTIDADKNGTIEYLEFMPWFESFKIKITKNEIKAIFAILDLDNNGVISLEEFKTKLKNLEEEIRQRELDRKKEEDRLRKEQEEKNRKKSQ